MIVKNHSVNLVKIKKIHGIFRVLSKQNIHLRKSVLFCETGFLVSETNLHSKQPQDDSSNLCFHSSKVVVHSDNLPSYSKIYAICIGLLFHL